MSNDANIVPWGDQGGALDYGKYAEDRTVVKLDKVPVLHVVQNNSPEFDNGTAQPGEVVVRIAEKGSAANMSLGSKFQGFVVARGVQYVWWPDRDDDEGGGMPLARCVKGDPVPPGCSAEDTLWPDRGGNARADGKAGPVADETHTLLVCPYRGGEVGTAAMLSYSRGGKKTGDGVQMLLNQFRGPCYAAMLEFYTEKVKNSEGQPYYVLKARGVGALPPDSPLLPSLKAFHDANQPHLLPKTVDTVGGSA
jgi:hypothetical protein